MDVRPDGSKRRVMLIADPNRESFCALRWALSHAVLEHDEIVLLHVDLPSSSLRKGGSFSAYFRRTPTTMAVAPSCVSFGYLSSAALLLSASSAAAAEAAAGGGGGGEGDFLDWMRMECEKVQPKVKVQVEKVEMDDKDKAAVIMKQVKEFGADLLVVGQRRNSTILGHRLTGPDTAEYLVDHSKCLCVGVQKKGQNAGYLLNTKTHKNFWLLA